MKLYRSHKEEEGRGRNAQMMTTEPFERLSRTERRIQLSNNTARQPVECHALTHSLGQRTLQGYMRARLGGKYTLHRSTSWAPAQLVALLEKTTP